MDNQSLLQDEADIQVGVPFDEEDADPEVVGWIHLEWRNKIEPLPLLGKKETPVDQSNPWDSNDDPVPSTNQKPSELDPRRNDQWDEGKSERRVSELDPRLRQPDPENERFSDRYGFNGPVRGSPGPGEHDRYGERPYDYGRERSREGDRDRRDNRDRDDRFDNGPYDDGPNRYDHEPDRNRGEPDHYGMSDRRYDSYNASPRGSNRDSLQRDHYSSNNSHSPRDHYSGKSSPHRYDEYFVTHSYDDVIIQE